jgi:hypothetical protein
MLEASPTTALKRVAAAIVIAALASGCSQTSSWLGAPGNGDAGATVQTAIPGTSAAEEYLEELAGLSLNDPALQAEIFADSQAAAELTPNPSTTLRFALVLATPGHRGSDPRQANSMLRELMARQALMTPEEIALATIYLNSTNELISLESTARQAQATSDRVQRTEEAAINQRLATVEAENRQLRQELEDAESKLEAITSIERDIRQQEE